MGRQFAFAMNNTFANLRCNFCTSSGGDLVYDKIYSRARNTIYIVDNYIGIRTLEKMINIPKGVKVYIFSDNLAKLSEKRII